jgi:hypothetical protein
LDFKIDDGIAFRLVKTPVEKKKTSPLGETLLGSNKFFLSAGVLTRRNYDWHKCSALRVTWGFKELPTVRKEAKETGT